MKDDIVNELQRLYVAHGRQLTAEIVVEEARSNKDGALHGEFNWNVKEAAYQYWLSKARELIATYTVVYRERTIEKVEMNTAEKSKCIPMFTHDPSAKNGYVLTQTLLDGPRKKDMLLEEYVRCAGHIARFKRYLEAAGLSAASAQIQLSLEACQVAIESLSESKKQAHPQKGKAAGLGLAPVGPA